jgi:glycosidase
MLYFLENHDEQRIASDFFAGDGKKGVPGVIVSALLNKNPFMFYAGQEFGERAMEREGFSGIDGRTTIFDYWCVETIRRGYYEPVKQTKEKRLADEYKKILSIANNSKAVAEGEMYDLMYVNENIGRGIFTFLRKADDELLFVVTNFSDETANVDITIPGNAFEYLNIPCGDYDTKELISGKAAKITLNADAPVKVKVPAWSGRVFQFKLNK